MKRTRNSIWYKIDMWFYRLTFRDVKNACKKVGNIVFEFIIALIGFLMIFIFPALFH